MNETSSPMKALVLAAGKGTRLRTEGCDLPKVMRQADGRPLLAYVLDALDFFAPQDIILVVGYQKEQVLSAFPAYPYAEQAQQLGTGHAVQSAAPRLADYQGDLLVCCGDMPLLRRETYEALCRQHRQACNVCTLLSGTSDVPLPYGRILRDEAGAFAGIVEDKDCTPEQREIRELNSGVYVFSAPHLFSVLSQLRADNAQGEYYLTDAPALLRAQGHRIGICRRELGLELLGVNTPEQLALAERVLRQRAAGMPDTAITL